MQEKIPEWKIGELKKEGRTNFQRNYMSCFLACIVLVFLLSGPLTISERFLANEEIMRNFAEKIPGTFLQKTIDASLDVLDTTMEATSFGLNSTAGAISTVYVGISQAGGLENAILGAVNRTLLGGGLSGKLLASLGILLSLIIYVFIGGALTVGVNRLFLENRIYHRTGLARIVYIFAVRKNLKTARIVFFRLLYLFLWSFTIFGFPIKFFSYYLVSAIQAENPDVPYKQVFKLSTQMMKGHKFHTFRLELSFILWDLLSIPTLGLLSHFWVDPYRRSSRAELYAKLRTLAKEKDLPGTDQLNDDDLFELYIDKDIHVEKEESTDLDPAAAIKTAVSVINETEAGVYPDELFDKRHTRQHRLEYVGAKDRYPAVNLILMFFIFAFVGWIWESALWIIEYGVFINRGTLYGPWIQIYGFGGLAIIILVNRFNKKPVLCFFMAMLVCGIIEYAGATILWLTQHMKYWDYSGYFLNIQGRVCLEGLLAFGILGMVAMYMIAPITDSLLERLDRGLRIKLCSILIIAFGTDFVLSQIWPRIGPGITTMSPFDEGKVE